MKVNVKYTDTFGGEANYCWVNRESFSATGLNDNQIVRRAKKAMGLSGVRGKGGWNGDMYEFRPFRMCTVMFITFDY